jgi:hypothetical protein
MRATIEQPPVGRQAEPIDESRGFYLGLDLGQTNDYTALVVIERVSHRPLDPMGALRTASPEYRKKFEIPDTYEVRHAERMLLHTTYPQIVANVVKFLRIPELVRSRVALAVDATGVGRPVFELFEQEVYASDLPRKPDLLPVMITAGNSETEPNGMYGVPKRELIHRAVKYMQKEELLIAKELEHTQILTDELQNFRLKINIATGHDTYEGWREKDHDDLVLALCIALWAAEGGDQGAFTIPLSDLPKGGKGSGLRLGQKRSGGGDPRLRWK